MKIYKYIGDGAGIPGLPREISEAASASFNKEQLQALKDALAAGQYKEIGADAPAKSKRKMAKDPKPEPEEGAKT